MKARTYRLGVAAIVVPTALGLAALAALTARAATGPRAAAAHLVQPERPTPDAASRPWAPPIIPEKPREVTPFAYRVVYIEDHTSDQWPVREAAATWDANIALSVRYGPCRNDAGCVRVYDGYYGRTPPWAGWTVLDIRDGRMYGGTIKFNDSYTMDAHERRQATCHEEGHAFGLDHAPTEESCMYYKASDEGSMYPSPEDVQLLNAVR